MAKKLHSPRAQEPKALRSTPAGFAPRIYILDVPLAFSLLNLPHHHQLKLNQPSHLRILPASFTLVF